MATTSFQIRIDLEVNCAFIRHIGQIGLAEVPESFDKILAHPKFRKGINILRDASEAVQPENYGYKFFQKDSPQRLAKYEQPFGNCKLAWVISNPREFAMVHQFTLARRLSEDTIERQPFKTIEAAKEWLNIPEDYEISYSE
ncbi:MAG: hypothetical protein HON14_05835 [Rhodospirillaceae bacterium]|jgi:hypothetical protein|nr:hypothetical protein [Rhodospirillaceae bacterium]MBT5941149.1 hypothetical protein [Rhodospirillaceae bacterium]